MSKTIRLLQTIFSSSLTAPSLLIFSYLIFLVIVRGAIPTASEIIDTFAELYAKYGYEIIFVSAFLESLVLVNLFVPGMVAMGMGAVFARTGQTDLTWVILTASSGMLLGYMIDYALGYFGFSDLFKKIGYSWILKESHSQLNRFGNKGLFLGFAYPNIASLLSLASGTSGMKFGVFLLIVVLSTAFWVPLWGLLIYSLGEVFLTLLTRYSFLIVIMVVASLILTRVIKGSKDVHS